MKDNLSSRENTVQVTEKDSSGGWGWGGEIGEEDSQSPKNQSCELMSQKGKQYILSSESIITGGHYNSKDSERSLRTHYVSGTIFKSFTCGVLLNSPNKSER